MKEKLMESLGGFGLVLVFIIRFCVCLLPLFMIPCNFLLFFLFAAVMYFFPISSIVFWVWGLVCALSGHQGWLEIVYYILFVVMFVPSFIDTIKSLKKGE